MLSTTFIGFLACCTINSVVSGLHSRPLLEELYPGFPKTFEQQIREALESAKNSDDLAEALEQKMDDVTALINQELNSTDVHTGDVIITRKGTVEICRVGACKGSSNKAEVKLMSVSDIEYSFDKKRSKVNVAKHRESDDERSWTPMKLDFTFSLVKPEVTYTASGDVESEKLSKGIKLNVKMTIEPMSCQTSEVQIQFTGPLDWTNIKCRSCGRKEKVLFRDAVNDQIKSALLRTVQPFVMKSIQNAICMSYIEPQVFIPFNGFSRASH